MNLSAKGVQGLRAGKVFVCVNEEASSRRGPQPTPGSGKARRGALVAGLVGCHLASDRKGDRH